MRIPLFAHDANPAVDRALVYKSHNQVLELLHTGQVVVLRNARGKEWAVQFRRILENTLASQLATFLAAAPDVGEAENSAKLLEILESHSERTGSSISDRENRANVGDADTAVAILRAQIKVKAWPLVGDEKALRIRCKS